MRYLSWFLRVVLFILLLGLAIKNNQTVTLRYFFGYEWQATQAVILLIFFAVGALVGVLAMLVILLKKRREISRLKRDIQIMNKLASIEETQKMPIQPS